MRGAAYYFFFSAAPVFGVNTSMLASVDVTESGTVSITGISPATLDDILTDFSGTAPIHTVTATPGGGIYGDTVTVSLQSNRAGRIYYTLDGTDPALLIGDDGTATWGDDGMEIIMDGG